MPGKPAREMMSRPEANGYYMLRPSGKNPTLTMDQPIYYFAQGPRAGTFRLLAATETPLREWIPWEAIGNTGLYDAWAPIHIADEDWRSIW